MAKDPIACVVVAFQVLADESPLTMRCPEYEGRLDDRGGFDQADPDHTGPASDPARVEYSEVVDKSRLLFGVDNNTVAQLLCVVVSWCPFCESLHKKVIFAEL
jgi:hypothetical protein